MIISRDRGKNLTCIILRVKLKREKALRWNLTKLWQCALVTVALPDTGCSGTLVREILICLLLCSRRALERGFSPQHLRNYHANLGLHIRSTCYASIIRHINDIYEDNNTEPASYDLLEAGSARYASGSLIGTIFSFAILTFVSLLHFGQ